MRGCVWPSIMKLEAAADVAAGAFAKKKTFEKDEGTLFSEEKLFLGGKRGREGEANIVCLHWNTHAMQERRERKKKGNTTYSPKRISLARPTKFSPQNWGSRISHDGSDLNPTEIFPPASKKKDQGRKVHLSPSFSSSHALVLSPVRRQAGRQAKSQFSLLSLV